MAANPVPERPNIIITRLSRAVSNNDLELVRDLILRCAQVDEISDAYHHERLEWRREPPIVTAARRAETNVLQTLIDAKASLDLSDTTDGKSPLHWACARNHLDIVHSLIKGGACANKADFNSETPMAEAIGHQNIDMVRMLLKNGAKLNVTVNSNRESALLFALLSMDVPIARLLLQAGAQTDQVNIVGQDPLQALLSLCLDQPPDLWLDLLRIVVYLRPVIRETHLSLLRAHPSSPACDIICEARSQPWSLRLQCRAAIRNRLLIVSEDTSILPSLNQLLLPRTLNDYLRFD